MVKFLHYISSLVITFSFLHGTNAGQFYWDFPVFNVTTANYDSGKEYYFCQIFEVPYEAAYITDFIQYGDLSNMNHVLFFKTTEIPHDFPHDGHIFECLDDGTKTIDAPFGLGARGNWEFLGHQIHNKKQPFISYGESVGHEIGTKSGFKYIFMQMHYEYPAQEDKNFGIRFNITDEEPERFAHFLNFGLNVNTIVPAHSITNVDVVVEITNTNDIEAFVTQYYWHNHLYYCVVGSNWRVHNLSEWSLINRDDIRYKMPNYKYLEEPVMIKNGDYIALRAVYHNDQDEALKFGPEEDEEKLSTFMIYTTTGHDPIEYTVHYNISFDDMFSNIPEVETNTIYGKYYEPCLNC